MLTSLRVDRPPDLHPAAFHILSLDGGGSKGFYTLGVLKEVEAALGGRPLCESFGLIFGTSTGSIIAALLALGWTVDAIRDAYRQHVPSVMRERWPSAKSAALNRLSAEVFGAARFEDVKTRIGVVATRWHLETPMIFKGDVAQAHGMQATFVPGFGCSIGDAVQASCAAYPLFMKKVVVTQQGEHVKLIDGGYCANNPTLYAIADAVMALQKPYADLRVLSVGVGAYPEPRRFGWPWLVSRLPSVQLLQKTLDVNTRSMEQLRTVLFRNVDTVRVSDAFTQPDMATDFLEHDLRKLDLLYQRGRESFAAREAPIRVLLAR